MNYQDICQVINETSDSKKNQLKPEQISTVVNNVLTQNGSVLLWNRGGVVARRLSVAQLGGKWRWKFHPSDWSTVDGPLAANG
jgi:hypothetical protein